MILRNIFKMLISDGLGMWIWWEETRNENTILVGKRPENRTLGRPRRCEDNFKMGLWKIGCKDGRCVELAQNRVQWRALALAVLNFRVLLPQCYC